MGYTYDDEKEKLIDYACSKKNEYNGPTEEVSIAEVVFDEKSRKCQIIYKIKKGKRTIDKCFTYMGEQYKIYSAWQYSITEKTKKITLTDNAIENLPNSAKEDNIIALSLSAIYKALPDHLIPMSVRINEVKKKYSHMKKEIEKHLAQEYDLSYLIAEKNTLNTKKLQVNEKIGADKASYSAYTTEINENVSILEAHNNSKMGWFYRFFDNKREKLIQKDRIKLSEINSTIEENVDNLSKIENKIISIDKEISFKTEERNRKLQNEYNNIELLMKQELESLEKNKNNLLVAAQSLKKKGPTEEWIKEERNKMGRIYQNGLTLRDFILERDNYTCQNCGNSKEKEPNLLLEVDHIYPVSKWGPSVPENLETLCWKCNRSKGNK